MSNAPMLFLVESKHSHGPSQERFRARMDIIRNLYA